MAAQPFALQVGGHGQIVKEDACLWKPTKPVEAEFYEQVAAGEMPEIAPFLPNYFGRRLGGADDALFIGLQDLTHGLRNPCVLDLKIGTQLYPDSCPEAKRRYRDEVARSTTTGSMGLRVCGLIGDHPASADHTATTPPSPPPPQQQQQQPQQGHASASASASAGGAARSVRVQYGSAYGKTLTAETFGAGLLPFLPPLPERRAAVLRAWLAEVRRIADAVQRLQQRLCVRLYGSSLLVVYDGHPAADAPPLVRMIDFTQTQRGGERDDGYLYGLRNLCGVLESLLAACEPLLVQSSGL